MVHHFGSIAQNAGVRNLILETIFVCSMAFMIADCDNTWQINYVDEISNYCPSSQDMGCAWYSESIDDCFIFIDIEFKDYKDPNGMRIQTHEILHCMCKCDWHG